MRCGKVFWTIVLTMFVLLMLTIWYARWVSLHYDTCREDEVRIQVVCTDYAVSFETLTGVECEVGPFEYLKEALMGTVASSLGGEPCFRGRIRCQFEIPSTSELGSAVQTEESISWPCSRPPINNAGDAIRTCSQEDWANRSVHIYPCSAPLSMFCQSPDGCEINVQTTAYKNYRSIYGCGNDTTNLEYFSPTLTYSNCRTLNTLVVLVPLLAFLLTVLFTGLCLTMTRVMIQRKNAYTKVYPESSEDDKHSLHKQWDESDQSNDPKEKVVDS
jgi:hypothetical protein